ncbi:MAG: sarcosine oxidase subunit gamma [bacterium]
MFDPITPLGHADPQTLTIGLFTIAERSDTALASLATRRGRSDDITRAAAANGVPLPDPGRYASETLSAFWLSPDMWMVEAPFASHEDIRAHLLAIFHDAASITEQTDAWVRFDLTAANLPDLMERLCNVDLRAAADHAATRTVIDHLGCYLIKRSATTITLYGPRSSAETLLHALTVAANSLT